MIKKRFASKKNIKTGLADIPQTPMLVKKRQGVRKKEEKDSSKIIREALKSVLSRLFQHKDTEAQRKMDFFSGRDSRCSFFPKGLKNPPAMIIGIYNADNYTYYIKYQNLSGLKILILNAVGLQIRPNVGIRLQ